MRPLVLNFSFGIVKWTPTDLENLQTKMRTLLTRYRFHHPVLQRKDVLYHGKWVEDYYYYYYYYYRYNYCLIHSGLPPLPPVALQSNAGQGLLMLDVSRSHTTTHHSR